MGAYRVIQGQGHCERHGDYNYKAYVCAGKTLGRSCPACLTENQRALHEGAQRIQAQAKANKLRDKLITAGVPEIFWDVDFASYAAANAKAKLNLDVVRSYADNFETVLATKPATGMLLHGHTGTGKTHLACALISALIAKGYTARYASAPALLLQLREASRGGIGQSLSALMVELSGAQLLVIDEYGAHTRNDYDYQLLFQLVDARYQRNLPTVTITNEDVKEVEAQLDQRILERLLGTAAPKLAFNWESARGKKLVQAQ